MNKITIHRALAELKLIDAKIEKGINEIYPTGIFQKGRKIDNWISEDEFKKNAQSQYDSVTDLINRKVKIKSAIVNANCVTKIKVGERDMTIADAINFKRVIEMKKKLVNEMKRKHMVAVGNMNKNNEIVQKNVETLLANALGKDNVKTSKEDVDAISKPYLDNNIFSLFNPLETEKKVEALEKEINEFESEVDACLSEANATTFIEF